jgi:REP element-mobilizing transposase RayT
MPDHAHILIGLNPKYAISEVVRDIKSSSSTFINEQKLSHHHFRWQEGYGAFSYSESEYSKVATYISNQPEHHKRQSFKDEYVEILNSLDIQYKAEYLFDWL